MDELTVFDISEILDVSEESVRRWIREGKLQAKRKLGRTGHTIYLQDLVEFVNQPPCNYLEKLQEWLDKEGIGYIGTRFNHSLAPVGAASQINRDYGMQALDDEEREPEDFGGHSEDRQSWVLDENTDVWYPATGSRARRLGWLRLENREESRDPESGIVQETQQEQRKPEVRQSEIAEKIRQKKMEILKLQQEVMRLEAKINIAKSEIQLYELEMEAANHA